jgi:hypothetical protein
VNTTTRNRQSGRPCPRFRSPPRDQYCAVFLKSVAPPFRREVTCCLPPVLMGLSSSQDAPIIANLPRSGNTGEKAQWEGAGGDISPHHDIFLNTLPIPIPISLHLRSCCWYFNGIPVLPSWSPSDALPVPDDRFIVLEFRSAPMPLLVRLARFCGGMFPWIVGFRSCEG